MEREKKRGGILGAHTLSNDFFAFSRPAAYLCTLLFARARKNRPYRAENQLPVQREAAIADVAHIHVHPLVKRHVIAVRLNLPNAGQTGTDIQALAP